MLAKIKRHPLMTFWIVIATIWTAFGIIGTSRDSQVKFITIEGVDCVVSKNAITCNWLDYNHAEYIDPEE